MKNEKLPTTNQVEVRSINWAIQSHIRLMALREVAAMSLGVRPDNESIENAKQQDDFLSAYRERQEILKSKISEIPRDGFVTCFPNHSRNKGSNGARNRIVDVVSCIEVLKTVYQEKLSREFLDLGKALSLLPLPEVSPNISESFVKLSGVLGDSIVKQGTAKKDQTKAARTKEEDTFPMLIYGLAKAAYNFNFNLLPGKQDEIIDEIVSDLINAGVVGYGLGSTKIKSTLERGRQAMIGKNLKP